jgi:NTE family protein
MSKLALVLAGGGGKGAYQIGVWKALREYGVDRNIGAVAGTSVGALNAVAFVQGDYELAERIWLNISHNQILKVDVWKLLKNFILEAGTNLNETMIKTFIQNKTMIETSIKRKIFNGIFSKDGLLNIIHQYINLSSVSTSEIECYVTCCHIPSFKARYFRLSDQSDEKITSILLASSALPIVFDVETIEGEHYIDGGLVDNVPIRPLYERGYRMFLIVHLSRDSVIETNKYPGAKIVQIVPKEHQGQLIDGTLDFSASNAIKRIQQGYEDTIQVLRPLYEMGMIQTKIYQSLHMLKKDNAHSLQHRTKILHNRQLLKDELGKLLNERGCNNESSASVEWDK